MDDIDVGEFLKIVCCSALGVWEQDFINGVVSDGDWAPNDQIGRLDG